MTETDLTDPALIAAVRANARAEQEAAMRMVLHRSDDFRHFLRDTVVDLVWEETVRRSHRVFRTAAATYQALDAITGRGGYAGNANRR